MNKKIIRKALPFMAALGVLAATAACDDEYEYHETRSQREARERQDNDDGSSACYLYYDGGCIQY